MSNFIFVKETLKQVNIIKVSNQLGLLEKLKINDTNYLGNCITGHKSEHESCFHLIENGNYWYCFSCCESGDVIDLVMRALGVEFIPALKWLAENFQPELLPQFEQHHDMEQLRITDNTDYTNAALYEDIAAEFKKRLYLPEGQEALSYLQNERHYDPKILKLTEWMYFPSRQKVIEYLLEKHAGCDSKLHRTISALPLNGSCEDCPKLAFPYRNLAGVITGFVKRTLDPQGVTFVDSAGKEHTKVRWDSSKGLKKDDLFGLHNCRKSDSLIIVEGYPDTLYLQAMGFPNIVAAGQGKFSKKHLVGLERTGVKKVIIAFDNDRPKEDGTMTGLENTLDAVTILLEQGGIEVFVIDPRKMNSLSNTDKHVKDPDEYLIENGAEVLKKFFATAPESACTWVPKRLAEKLDLTNSLEKSKYFDECSKWYEKFNSASPIAGEDFLNSMAAVCECDREVLKAELSKLVRQLDATAGDQASTKAAAVPLRLSVLGHNEKMEIAIWHKGQIYNWSKMENNRENYHLLTGEYIEKFDAVKKQIVAQAHKGGRISSNKRIGSGVWMFGDFFYIISGQTLIVVNGDKIEKAEMPVISKASNQAVKENILVSFEKDVEWLDQEHFFEAAKADGLQTLKSAFEKLLGIVRQWTWPTKEACKYVTAAIMLSVMQHSMLWRPIVYVAGPRFSGKTTLFEVIEKIFNGLALKREKMTAHALLQEFGNSGRIIILDEFEKYRHDDAVLEMLKICGRGGTKSSGTPGQCALEFKMHHLAWLGSIYVTLNDEAQRSRAVRFDLNRHSNNPPEIPSNAKLKKLGAEIVAGMIKCWPIISERYFYYKANTNKFGCDGRTVENLSYMLGLIGIVDGVPPEQIPEFLKAPIIREHETILNLITTSQIRDGQHINTVSELLADTFSHHNHLERNGLKVMSISGRRYLAINTGLVTRFLLKDLAEYKRIDISAALERIPGAIKKKVRMNLSSLNCIVVPWEAIDANECLDASTTDV